MDIVWQRLKSPELWIDNTFAVVFGMLLTAAVYACWRFFSRKTISGVGKIAEIWNKRSEKMRIEYANDINRIAFMEGEMKYAYFKCLYRLGYSVLFLCLSSRVSSDFEILRLLMLSAGIVEMMRAVGLQNKIQDARLLFWETKRDQQPSREN